MKKYTLLFLSMIIFFLFPTSTYVHANKQLDRILINEYKEDITGDGIKDTLHLYGDLLSANSNYFHNIYVIIKTKDNHKWKIHYNGGYDPKLKFIDLTHNSKKNILFQSMKVESGDVYHHHLHAITRNEIEKINLPDQNAKGALQDNFQATVDIPTNYQSISLDLQKYKEYYIKSGIYNKDGSVSSSRNLIVDSSRFYEPVVFQKSKGYSLKSYQSVKNPINYKRLGTIETLWYYEENKWIVVHSNWEDKT